MTSPDLESVAIGLRASVVIPVLNPRKWLPKLLEVLMRQQPEPPLEIILVDSDSKDNPRELIADYPCVRLIPIANFSHGRSRNLGAQAAKGDIIALLSQDALPQDESWLANLLHPFSDPTVGAVFSRQVPHPDAPPTEKFFLNYHFPPGESRRWQIDEQTAPEFGRTVFFSNVSAAIRRECLLKHPFDETLIMSEDQQLARDLLAAGKAVVYQPESVVWHSHRYSLLQAFRRYFDSVYSLTQIFSNHDMKASASLGVSYLRKEATFILRHHPFYLPYYFLYTVAKTAGTVAGHHAQRLPRKITRFCSMHRYHWDSP